MMVPQVFVVIAFAGATGRRSVKTAAAGGQALTA
jgi:hypothetical protein